MNYEKENLSTVRRECIEFAAKCDKVLLATENADGDMEVGFSPFVQLHDEFYLYQSECSVQSEYMLDSGQANLMFIEDELSSPYLFARPRLTYQCEVRVVPIGYQYTRIMVAFQERLGSLMDTLRRVPNCQILRITPNAGRYVNNLAQAFTFKGYHANFLDRVSTGTEQLPQLKKSKVE